MLWLVLALCSAMILGGYEIARKAAVRDNAVLPVLLTANLGGLVFLCAGLVASPLVGSRAPVSLELVPLSAAQHLAVAIKAALVTASWVLSYFAVKHLPISVAGPLRATSPVVTLLGATLLFQEAPSTTQWLGILVIFAGYFAFAVVGRREGINYAADRWIALLLLGTCVGATSGLYDKWLLQYLALPPTTLQFWFSVDNVLLQSLLVLALWWPRRSRQPYTLTLWAPLVGVFLTVADQLYYRALSDPEALVSVVSITRRSSVLISFTLGGLLFREKLLKQKASALLVLLLGLALLFV